MCSAAVPGCLICLTKRINNLLTQSVCAFVCVCVLEMYPNIGRCAKKVVNTDGWFGCKDAYLFILSNVE